MEVGEMTDGDGHIHLRRLAYDLSPLRHFVANITLSERGKSVALRFWEMPEERSQSG